MIEESTIIADLKELLGRTVAVGISVHGIVRDHFDTAIFVSGALEKHPDHDRYRVVQGLNTYCYFEAKDVMIVHTLVTTPTIFLKTIPVFEG